MAMLLNRLLFLCRSFITVLRRRNGQTLAEYGIMVAVIAVVVIVAAMLFGSDLSGLFGSNAGRV
jgi:Flp pilus assembly pilin Flp